MNKSKAKFLFTLICVLLATLITMTFIRFTTGITDYNSIIGAINLDYDIGGGYAYEITLADDNEEDIDDQDVMKAVATRLDYLGFKGYTLKAVKNTDNNASSSELNSKYVITVPASIDEYGKDDVTMLTESIKAVVRGGEVEIFYGTQNDTTNKISVEGKIFESVEYMGQQGDVYGVAAKFTEEAWEAIETAESSATDTFYIKVTLGDVTLVNGSFKTSDFIDKTIYLQDSTEAGARQQALQIAMGGLNYKFNVDEVEAVEVQALLGEKTEMLLAIIVGAITLAIIVTLFVLFKGFGVVSMITLLGFIFTYVAMLVAVPGIVLSIPGVIGMVLTLIVTGVNVFATIKSVKEEFAKGKTIKSAIKTAFNSSFKTVVNVCVIIVIVALSLIIFTTGTATTLGATLGIGAVISFIATTLLSRLIANCMVSFIDKPEVVFDLKRTEE